ncbi:MAG: ThuA domain-containing protein [Asticcacaulis sp.]
MLKLILSGMVCAAMGLGAPALAQGSKPVKVLLVSGGGWHDYAAQRDILETGLKARLNVTVDHVFYDITPQDDKEKPALPIFSNPAYADGYDVVIHNECAAGITDQAIIDTVLAPHLKGVPAVNLHCAMHSYRWGNWRQAVDKDAPNAKWYAFTGMQSTGHGPQAPVVLSKVSNAPVLKGLEMWTTPDEELYNTLTDFGVIPLIVGTQPDMPDPKWQNKTFTVAWLHYYGPEKTRVFSTTLVHNEASMRDARYLDLVARGVAWAVDGLTDEGDLKGRLKP